MASLHEEVDGGDGTPLAPAAASDLSRASEELPDVAGAVGGMGDQTQVTDPILGSLPGIHHPLFLVLLKVQRTLIKHKQLFSSSLF